MACMQYLRVEAEQSAKTKESMPLLYIIAYVAQSCAPWAYKVSQMRGNALRADPCYPSQRDGTAMMHATL